MRNISKVAENEWRCECSLCGVSTLVKDPARLFGLEDITDLPSEEDLDWIEVECPDCQRELAGDVDAENWTFK